MRKIQSIQGMRFCLFLTIFLFHLDFSDGMIGNSSIYVNALQGGGMLAVAYFFVLSGFVASFSESGRSVDSFGSYLQFIWKKSSKFYVYHLFFLIAILPIHYKSFVHEPVKNFCVLVCNLLLMQSWIPKRSVWLSYNGVTWFCSTLLFLSACSPWLYKLFHGKIGKWKKPVILFAEIVLLWGIMVCAAWLCPNNESYWLYAFPPMRLLDYVSGYILCEIYKTTRVKRKVKAEWEETVLDIFVVIIYVTYLLMFPYLDIYIRRTAIYLPGALFTIWVLVNNSGWLERLLSRKKMSELGGKTLYYMMCHQVILKYINRIMKVTGSETLLLELGGGIFALFLTLLSEPIYNRFILDKFERIRQLD